MSLLVTILTALAPHLVDMFIEILKAEKDPALDTAGKKHDHVLTKVSEKIGDDPTFERYAQHDIKNAVNIKIKDTVQKLNESGEFEKGADK